MTHRETLEAINRLLSVRPDLSRRYELAKQVIRAFRLPAFYEMSTRCNLFCEGCYYFENSELHGQAEEARVERWQDFFEAERRRHVSMGYFVGAEPALEQGRLRAAAGRIPYGKVGTNGTILIDRDIPFRIGVSVWGDDQTDTMLRGGSVLRKALRNYAGDPRAIMLFTLSPWNLHTMPEVLRMCEDNGLPVTFNIFSPTQVYLEKIRAHRAADNRFYRIAPSRGAPVFDEDGLKKLKDSFAAALEDFPETVIFSSAYADWVCQPGPLYDIDEDGIAVNCSSRIRHPLRYHDAQLKSVGPKCCTPDVDCSECRLYSGGWSSKFVPDAKDLVSPQAFERWLDMLEVLGRIFLYPLPEIYRSIAPGAPVTEDRAHSPSA